MAETGLDHGHDHSGGFKLDRTWAVIVAIPILLAIFDAGQVWPTLGFAGDALITTLPIIALAVLAVAYMKASGAEALLARAFEGREVRMILLAAALGGLSPFCSCEVIPFIAALLAVGAPLSAVMAFWLSSPLMDPAMFLVTAGTLGVGFAAAKTAAAILMGVMGGFIVKAFASGPVFAEPLRAAPVKKCGCGGNPFTGRPHWRFWDEPSRVAAFRESAIDNALFLGKWLLLAYLLEALMLHYVPADWIATVLGGQGIGTILIGALVGAPAYLNGYAAVPLIDALLEQGMSNGAAMSFAIAGGVSCIPAAVAVWALVKPRVFAAYLSIALLGAVLAGMGWAALA